MKGFAKVLTFALVALLCTSTVVLADNTHAVTQPGLEGTGNKLSVTLDGTSVDQSWVQDNTPVCEETYNWELEFSPDGNTMDSDDKIAIINVRQEAPADVIIRCVIRQAANPANNVVNCLHRKEGGGFVYAGQVGMQPASEPNIRMEVVRASGAGMNDGIIRLFKNGVMVHERTDRPTFGTCIDRFRIGQTSNITTGPNFAGDLEFDEVVTTR